jgi:hypothetical protein
MSKCIAMTAKGAHCRANAGKDSEYCFMHDPARGAECARARKLGGQRRRATHGGDTSTLPVNVRTLDDVFAVLDYALAEALPLENSIQRGRLLVAIAGAFVEAIKTGELEARLAAIENTLKLREKSE